MIAPSESDAPATSSRAQDALVDELAARREHRLIRFSDKVNRLKKEKEEAEEEVSNLRQVNKDLATYLARNMQRSDSADVSELQANLEQMRQEASRLLKENEELRVEKHAFKEYEAGISSQERRARLEAEVQLNKLREELDAMKIEMSYSQKPNAALLREQRRRIEAEVLMKEFREEVEILKAEVKTLRAARE